MIEHTIEGRRFLTAARLSWAKSGHPTYSANLASRVRNSPQV
ncbi:protein of unknown function [Cupriavidus taiwanensis]|uniref:Uncharacterized protein n=1 Tax=Cupriavidus taiwanensis TaxID=164546 RepID=A0A375GXT5_9BURK|nr:hypothetical protein CBM2588_A140030 [Cupriavidus taiwanensis]SOY48232.1 hypothetical protein CBM2592_A180031 [Cupriavidus taiwanensis]SOY82749.1 hypothetical protein CBM2591_A220031 [Cupriavidus taiwanensis]SOZ23039.1 hypothetical protein CBM2608_A210063 [Cupriavidus taiwanensis]SOZ55359.1 hypothetical protein CBM2617_A190093 [Cupriavidus taiwanensis]